MMPNKNYYSAQEILKRCFNNNTGKLNVDSAYSVQDYLNAVYDEENDSLRVGKGPGGGGGSVVQITVLNTEADRLSMANAKPGIYLVRETQLVYCRADSKWYCLNDFVQSRCIEFTSSNGPDVTWNGSVAVFRHGLGCVPLVCVYDDAMEQAAYGCKVVDGNTVSIDFVDRGEVTGRWRVVLSYGCEL